jgi:hypothetical protein
MRRDFLLECYLKASGSSPRRNIRKETSRSAYKMGIASGLLQLLVFALIGPRYPQGLFTKRPAAIYKIHGFRILILNTIRSFLAPLQAVG